MSEQPPLLKHLNKGLFADYFLNERVPQMDGWDDALAQAADVQKKLRALREKVNPDNLDEAQLEQQWIRPVFEQLGLPYALQVKFRKGERGHVKPDYVFTRSPEEAASIGNDIYTPDDLRHTLAVADAKKWGIPLDKTINKNERNPAQQIDEYLRYSERPWGVLTDGKYWRLYHRDNSKNNVYYAVDLEALLVSETDAFNYFYAFFRLEAFTSGFLQRVLARSQDFAQKVTDDLEQQVYDALTEIAQGFIDYRRNDLTPTPDTLAQVYQASLVLLYRLLFIFYAESRQILPLEHEPYRTELSMDALKKTIVKDLTRTSDNYQPFDPDGSSIYGKLKDLFFAIDRGNPRYRVPPYNGKLFSKIEHPFLDDYTVGDAHLAPALDKLSRVTTNISKTSFERVFVDYRDLDVRHLGSIYEKLLDYELDVAETNLTESKKGQFVPATANDEIIVPAGKLFLRTGSFERKTTGSYYTPDYIVRFIVEKTLSPLLTAITEKHATKLEGDTWQVNDAPKLVNEVLSLNILDPATGSGHFAVDAVSYIAEWLTALAITPQDVNLEDSTAPDEDELVTWKRLVAGACIYAVDSNPLAVELAKLSLWLTTLARGKPLSFLDHHIRVGNSLVGAKVSALTSDLSALEKRQKRQAALEQAAAMGQMSMFGDDDLAEGVRTAASLMRNIETTVASSVDDVKKQEQLYAQLTERLSYWQHAADVWTAKVYGLPVSESDWRGVWQQATTGKTVPEATEIIRQAQELAREQHFFHWELAFPEVFFDADGQPKADPGFDAVIGNPPYVRWQSLNKATKDFFASQYEIYNSSADLFLYFFERGINFLKRDHLLGYITSGTYMNSNSAKGLREYINKEAALEWVANFGENQPFVEAEMVYPTIIVLRHGKAKKTFNSLFLNENLPRKELSDAILNSDWVDSLSTTTSMAEWRFQAKELTYLFQKITDSKVSLSEYVNGKIHYGVLTGLTEAFVVDENTRNKLIEEHSSSSEVLAPMIRGQDLRPWYQMDSNLYLILAKQGINLGKYPAIKRHLEEYFDKLQVKPSDWNAREHGKWQGRTAGSYQWFEWHDTVAYFKEFSKPKIFWSEISKLPRMSFDNQGRFTNNKCYFIRSDSYTLLALMQSRVTWYVISQIATPLRLRRGLWQYQLFKQFIERLPIPELSADQETILAELAETITEDAQKRYQLHEDMRQTIISDFRGEPLSSRVALYRWWELEDEKALSDEIEKRFGQEIPLKQRSQWRSFLKDQKAQHDKLTQDIIKNEIILNDVVYDAFGLDAAERKLVEETTKYKYGEV